MHVLAASAAGSAIGGSFLLIFLAVAYFIPSVIAIVRKAPSAASVVVVNVFFGWTVVGWAVALAMALRSGQAGYSRVPPGMEPWRSWPPGSGPPGWQPQGPPLYPWPSQPSVQPSLWDQPSGGGWAQPPPAGPQQWTQQPAAGPPWDQPQPDPWGPPTASIASQTWDQPQPDPWGPLKPATAAEPPLDQTRSPGGPTDGQ